MFGIAAQNPQVQALIQQNLLVRVFEDSLYPGILFRGEATPQEWPAGVGETMVFSASGLVEPDLRPIAPGDDPPVVTAPKEQWTALLQQYGQAMDINTVTSTISLADMLLRNTKDLALGMATILNRAVRDRLFNAAESGYTTARGTQTSSTSINVNQLNGFTTARNPNLPAASTVRFDPVSSSNPLAITVLDDTSTAVSRNVIGFTNTVNPGDQTGPGTLLLDVAVAVTDRNYIISVDRPSVDFVGGGNSTDAISVNDTPRLADVQTAVGRMDNVAVPTFADGYYHCHLDSTSQGSLFRDPNLVVLNTGLPDHYIYGRYALGRFLRCLFIANRECPQAGVNVKRVAGAYTTQDPFAPDLYSNGSSSTGVPLHRMLFIGADAIYEYWMDANHFVTDAGITGKMGDAKVVNNGIDIMVDRVKLVLRSPLDRFQQKVSVATQFVGDWPVRTDSAAFDVSRFKRVFSVVGA